MSSFINNFNIFRDFPSNLSQSVKTFDISLFFGYCVLNDNKVYGFGEGIHEFLDNQNKSNEKYVLITELKNIQEFYKANERNVVFARNDKNEIFSWGSNYSGQLARGYDSRKYLKPEKIDFFDNKNIINISCGNTHCLALSSDGLVYAWGDNSDGQIGCEEEQGKIISTPIEIKFEEKIKFILCKRYWSSAVSFDGNVYYWGNIGKEGIYPVFGRGIKRAIISHPLTCKVSIKIKSILNTMCDWTDIYVLSFERIIYRLGEQNKGIGFELFCDLNKTMNEKKIIDICEHRDLVICQTENCVYLLDNSKVAKTSYKTLFEYFLFEEQKTFKTIHIKDNQLFVWDLEKSDDNSEPLKQIYTEVCDSIQNDSLRTSRDLPQILESNVKYLYQSGNTWNYFSLLVKNENKVYCCGYNQYAKLGLGHEESVYEYTEIIELKDKNIQEFYEGENCMFARNDLNEIFSWGSNKYGQLARGYESREYLKPEKIDFFDGKNIIQISFGCFNCLALSSDGRVYEWASYRKDGREQRKLISTPIEIDLKEKIKYIHCNDEMFCAVSFDGNPYYWGNNLIFTPKLIPINNVLKVGYILFNRFIILDKNGKVFKFNSKDEKITEIQSEENIIDLCDHHQYHDQYYEQYDCLLKSADCVFQFQEFNNKLIKTDFIDFKDFYSQQLNYCKKTIEVTKDGYLMTKEIHFNKKKEILEFKDENVFERKYENLFEQIGSDPIGRGSFGEVFKVKKKSNQIPYAIKRIEIMDELDLKEIKLMSKLKTNYVVQYFDSWIEGQMIFGKIRRYLLIQMELCSMNFKKFIKFMDEIRDERFQTFYFISCELFKELIECVNYLHSIPIIHRDLNPKNILISDGINGRFLKLCDFGLAKIHEKSCHSRMVGTMSYMAPEVLNSTEYNPKSDVYSLGIIATEIFGFENRDIRNHTKREDFDKYLSKYSDQSLKEKIKKVLDLISKCLTPEDYHLRPDCKELLEKFNEFSVDKSIVLNDKNYSDFKSFFDKQNTILKTFFESKINI